MDEHGNVTTLKPGMFVNYHPYVGSTIQLQGGLVFSSTVGHPQEQTMILNGVEV